MCKVSKKGLFQECYSGVFMISLENIFESLIFVNLLGRNRNGAPLLVKLQAFTVNDSDRINDRVCF